MRIAALIALLIPFSLVEAGTARWSSDRAKFQQSNPCPSNGAKNGECPGYVVYHRKPLCAFGKDERANMEWVTIAMSNARDKEEKRLCKGATMVYR